ncbi:MAG: hypothetical protein EZS28_000246 [Streblomastix strix]|uniref:Uncharacterized protein n=1 Tax=Streblomastix strix TaxID=222440 RepID=A0A5J4XBP0_9EUKA|nr:MAG: hypothetical protein EZS28_000246 [Streblomastix strix]
MNDRYDANDIRQRPPMPTHLCSLIFNWCSEHWKRPCVGGIAIKEKKEIKLKGWRYKRQPLFPRSYYEYGGTNREFILNREINQRQKEIENGINVMSTRKYNSITDKTQRKDEKEDEMKKNEGNEEQFVDYCFGEVQLSDNFNKNRNNKERERKTNDDEQEDEGDEDADSDSYKQNSDIERGKSKLKKSQKSMEKNTDFKSQTNTNMIRFGEQKRNQSDYIYLEEEDFVFIEDEEDEDDYENSDEYEKNTIFQNKNGKEEKIQHQLERQDSETNEFVVISQEGINNNQSIASQQTISSASSASSPLYPQTPNSVQSRQQQQQQQNQVLPFGSLKLIGSKQAIHPVPLPHPLTVQDQITITVVETKIEFLKFCTQSSLFPISQTQQKGIKSQSPLSAIQHIDNEYQSESRQRSESMNSNKSNLSKLSQNSESEGNRNMSRQGIADNEMDDINNQTSTASLFSQQQAQLQSSQSGIGIGMNPNISINERDRINTINVSSMSTSNLGFVYNPNSNAGDEFNLVHIAQIQFTNGVTHTTFHPKERVVAIGSSKRNIVGIYEVSFQVPKQSSSSTQGEQENQRERNKDRGKEKDKEKDKEKEREKKNTQLNKVNNVRIFQIPPPAPPQLHIEKVDEQIKKYLTIKKLEPLTHPQEYTPMSFPRLATLDFLNEGSDTRMIISTQDSAVKVLSFPDDNNACRLITSFFAFPLSLFAQDGLQSNINQQLSRQSSVSSMINVVTPSPYQQQSQQAPQSQLFNPTFLLSWSQRTGLLAAAGEPLQYRIWDVAQEQCILDQETGFDSPSSSLALDQLGWTLAIGSHYGVVRLFDRREYDVEPVMSLCLDDNPLRPSNQDFALSDDVVNLAFTATRQHELIAAARNTQIALFDLRMPKQRQRRKDLITHNNTNMNQSLRINNNGCFFPYSLLSLNGGIIPLKKGQSLAQGFAQRFSSSTLSQVDKSLSQNAMINPDLYYNEESPSDQSTIPQWLWNSRGKGHAYLVNRRLGSHYMSTTNCFAKVDNLSNILHDTQGQSSDGIAQGDVRSSRQQIASTGQHDQDIEHTAAFAIHPLFPYALLATTERKNNYAFGLQNGELIQYERACAQLGTSQVIGSAQKLQLGMDGDPPVQTMAWHPNEGALVVSYGTKHANVFVKA